MAAALAGAISLLRDLDPLQVADQRPDVMVSMREIDIHGREKNA